MKRILYILASLLILAGCNDMLNVADKTTLPDGEMAVNLVVDGPMAGPGTRSYVSGQETAISTIKMICFDGGGSYLTARDGVVTATDATHGTLTGTVPANTARIHFVANFAGLDLSSFSMGALERTMMKSGQLSSGINDDVRFWGYHKEESTAAMSAWLTGGNKVILLRDRAKITVTNSDADIASLQWTVSNGLNKGLVAAMSSSDNSNPYDNTYSTSTILTEYRSSGTYTLSDAESIWTGPGAANPQFLFENANSTDPVKIIVKATYTDGTTRYHTILLQDKDKKMYRIYRNQSFVLTIKDLPSKAETTSVGSDSFEDAVTTTNYSNNPFAQVAREVNEINNEEYRLTVEKVELFYDSGTSGTVNFTYTDLDGNGVSGVSDSDFEVSWEPKDDTDERPDVSPVTTAPAVTYSASTGKGTITFPLNTITSELKFNTLQVVAPSGLTRYVDVYSITAFSFATAPKLVDNGTKRSVGDYQRETYKLTFALPATLPNAVYPLTVKMYTGTLVPFSDNTATAPHGSFNVAVDKTNFLDATDQSNQWNYNANKWDSWYEFVISELSADNSYTVYLNAFVEELFPALTKSTVGLYFEIDNFGGRIPLSAAAPQPTSKTVTFDAASFSFSDHAARAEQNGITVALSNSSKSGNNITTGYRTGDWFWGYDYYDGIISFSTNKAILTGITLSYVNGQTGGPVTASTGSFTKNTSTGVWSGGNNTQNVTLTMTRNNNNNYPQLTSIAVTYLSY